MKQLACQCVESASSEPFKTSKRFCSTTCICCALWNYTWKRWTEMFSPSLLRCCLHAALKTDLQFLYLDHLKLESLCKAFTSVVLCECWIMLIWKSSERIQKAFGKWEICLTDVSKKNVYAVCLKKGTLKVSMQLMVIWPSKYPQSLWFKPFPCKESFRLAEGSHLC